LGNWTSTGNFTMIDNKTLAYTGTPTDAETQLHSLALTPINAVGKQLPPGSISLSKLSLSVSDGVAEVFERDAELHVTVNNSAPTGISIDSTTVPENYIGFYPVGELEGTDADYGDFHSFQIVESPADGLFSISGGILYAKAAFDYESLNQYELTVRATDVGGLFFDEIIMVKVTDVRTEDTDLDGLTEEEEEDLYGSSDLLFDTDKDGYGDTSEVNFGSNPVDPFSTPLGVLGRSVPIGGHWRSLDWLGAFDAGSYPWIYHVDLGWAYPIEGEDGDLWLWLAGVGWIWTSPSVYPYLHDSNGDAWLYLAVEAGTLHRFKSGEWVKQ
jgi:hypothetical protein